MRIIIMAAMILSLVLPPLCLAQDSTFKEAYSLYYKGKNQEAIKIMDSQGSLFTVRWPKIKKEKEKSATWS